MPAVPANSSTSLRLRGCLPLPRGRTLAWGGPVHVMGILNCTPDSFFDGGAYGGDPDVVAAAGLRMVEEGATILDIGGESTRPGACPVAEAEEIRRVVPVIERLRRASEVVLSLDTSKAAVARAGAAAGADLINDVTALGDPDMAGIVAGHDLALVLMHMRGTPQTMQQDPRYDDAVAEVSAWLFARAAAAVDAGIGRDRLLLDPGLGFGKTFDHNALLLHHLSRLGAAGFPVLVGASRKSMIAHALGLPPAERLEASLALAVLAAERGAAVLRVHDVRATVRAVRMTEAVLAAAQAERTWI